MMNAFPEGTENYMPSLVQFEIPPRAMVSQLIIAFVRPVIGERDKPWTGPAAKPPETPAPASS